MTGSDPRLPRSRRRLAALGAAVMAGALTVLSIPAGPATAAVPADSVAPKRIMSGWLPYWTNQASTDAFLANADLFSDISPFWHNAAKSSSAASGVTIQNNALSSGSRSATLATLKGHGALVMPSITDGTGSGYLSAVMRNTGKRAAFVAQISNLVVSNGYDGVDLDFEKFAFSDAQSTWNATRPAWVAFVKQLAAALHANGKKLAVAVPPMGVAGNNYWVYDWAGIASSIDKLRIMAYDYSWDTPGPIGGPISWAEKVAAYAVSVMSPSKVQLGTPTYGRDWVKSKSGTGCPATSQKVYDSKNIGTAISGVPASSWKRDAASLERYFNYTVSYNGGACKVTRSAWLPDAATVAERARVASRYGLNGIATWTIGGEDPGQWAPLRDIAIKMPFSATTGPRAQRLSTTVSKTRVKSGRKITVRGTVSPARSGVRVRLQAKKGSRWITRMTRATRASGGYTLSARPTAKKVTYRVVVSGGSGFTKRIGRSFTVRTF